MALDLTCSAVTDYDCEVSGPTTDAFVFRSFSIFFQICCFFSISIFLYGPLAKNMEDWPPLDERALPKKWPLVETSRRAVFWRRRLFQNDNRHSKKSLFQRGDLFLERCPLQRRRKEMRKKLITWNQIYGCICDSKKNGGGSCNQKSMGDLIIDVRS